MRAQEEELRYLAGDKLAGMGWSGPALVQLISKAAGDQAKHLTEQIQIRSDSIRVMRGGDERFPPDALVVEQVGSKTIMYRNSSTGDLLRIENLNFDNKYRMVLARGSYDIYEQRLSETPGPISAGSSSPTPARSPSAAPSPSTGFGSTQSQQREWPAGALVGAEAISGLLILGGLFLLIATPRRRRRREETSGSVAEERTSAIPLGGAGPSAPLADGVPARSDRLASGWPAPMMPGALHVRTIGELRLWTDTAGDLTSDLRKHPVQSFLWLCLLIWAMDRSKGPVDRGVLAEELYPRLDAKTRRKNLRNRLFDLKSLLPAELSGVIRSDALTCRFDLDACWIDLIELIRLADQTKSLGGWLPTGSEETAELALRSTAGEFLSFWDDLAGRVTDELDASTEMVKRQRSRAVEARTALAMALARNRRRDRRSGEAVGFLEDALAAHPEREDVARELYSAYVDLGRGEEGRRLAKSYGFDA
jgi:DNA-binding SARP family transcriptional activator